MADHPYATHLNEKPDTPETESSTAERPEAETFGSHRNAAVDRYDEPEDFGHEEAWKDSEDGRHLSVLGRSLVFKGELSAEEDLLIQGRVEGTIKHNATSLTVGANGDVRANITGRRVIIQGKVHGDVLATESVAVEASARMRGKIVAPRVGIKEGAKFKGSIDMDADADTVRDTKSKAAGSKREARKTKEGTGRDKELSDTAVDSVLK